MKQTRIKQILFTGMVLIWMLLIFWFSAKPAEESTQMSLAAGKAFATVFIPGYTDWPESKQTSLAREIDHPVRKAAHATEYAVLAMLCFGMLGSYGKRGKRQYVYSLLWAALYAGTDEFHQLFVPGRSGQLTDVLIDSGGAFLGLCLLWIFFSVHEL